MVGAADPLDQAFDVLGRADLNDQIDIAPVDPQIEAAGTHDRPQLTVHHRLFDPLSLLSGQAAVVDADRQAVLVREPKVVKENLGLRTGVVKDQRGFVLLDLFEHRGDRVAPAAAGPRGRLGGFQHPDVRIGAGVSQNDFARVGMLGQHPRDGCGVVHGGGQAHAAHVGAQSLQAGNGQHQLIAAFGFL